MCFLTSKYQKLKKSELELGGHEVILGLALPDLPVYAVLLNDRW